ncbi:MAG: glycosyltransferase family 4 protein [Limnohabitans sp.]
MRIVIDMQGAQTESRFRGIGRYSLSLTQAIAVQAEKHEVFLALNANFPDSIAAIRLAFKGLISESRIRVFDVPSDNRHGMSWRNLASEIIREEFILSLNPDVVLVTSMIEHPPATSSVGLHTTKVPTAAILYDLIPLLNEDQYLSTNESREHYFRKIEWLKCADLLLGISESSCQEGINYLKRSTDNIINISTAIGSDFKFQAICQKEKDALLSGIGIARKFVMYAPGGFDPRKNFGRLIEAFSLLPEAVRAEYQLLIVSKLNMAQRQELELLRIRYQLRVDELVMPGYVKDEELIALYSIASLFIFPSLHEGFGLPALEAMACGAIVIGSNRTSVPEVIGCSDALFDPVSVGAIRNKMLQALTDEKFKNNLRAHGHSHARKFTWDACARKTIEALEKLHEQALKLQRIQREVSVFSCITALAELQHSALPEDTDLLRAALCLAFNAGSNKSQLFLDISSLVHADAKSGIQRVVRSLLVELMRSPPTGFDVKPIWFDGTQYRHASRFLAMLHRTVPALQDELVEFFQKDVYLSLDLIMHLTPQVHDLHKELSVRGLKLFYIVYDVLLVQHPEWWESEHAPRFNRWLKSISEISTGLICISEAVANDVRAWIRENPPKRLDTVPSICSFHLGADLENSLPTRGMPERATQVLRQINDRKTFLMVSTIEPRKGYAQALAAFELLWQQGHDVNLVIVGKRGWLVDELVERISAHDQRGQRLFWLEGISDEYLEKIYQSADCLIVASEGEGFGLSLIEAAQYAMPIIARDLPIFREVAAEHAHYFQGLEPAALAAAIDQWLRLHAEDAHPSTRTMKWLTWRESAQQLLQAMNMLNCKSIN